MNFKTAEPIQEEKGKEEQKEEEIEKEEEKEVDEEQEVSAAWDAVSFLEEYFEEDVYFQIWENDAISLADEWDQRHCVRKTKVTREDFGRMKKKWKTEKPSKKFIKAPRYHKRLENAMIQEELLLREKENSAAKRGTTYQPYVPPIITARSTTTPATATTTPRNTHNAHRATTNNRTIAEEDAEIQRALQASIAEMSTSSLGEALSTQQIQLLSALQARDLTPEDYEILLLLDSSVKPKTLIPDQVKSFPQLTVDTEDMCSERCAVCMMEYEKEERLTKLPNCGHLFHSDCIGHWLCNSSVNCPIDGLPVTNT